MAVIIHQGTTFVVSDETGDLVAGSEQGCYFEDVRSLSRLQFVLDGERLVPLIVERERENRVTYFATNARTAALGTSTLAVRRTRWLDGAMREEVAFQSFADGPVRFELRVLVEADFLDIYAAKKKALSGDKQRDEPKSAKCSFDGATFELVRDIEGSRCITRISFDPPARFERGHPCFEIDLSRGQIFTLRFSVTSRIEHPDGSVATGRTASTDRARRETIERAAATLETDHATLQGAYARAAADFVALRLNAEQNFESEIAVAAGIPWYMALFGRDSLIASYQAMTHDPALAKGTLIALAHLQGKQVDPASEEQPGRILHEYRRCLKRSVRRNIPKFPYYGTADATLLFIIVLSEYVRVTGDLGLARDLGENLDRALAWIARYGDVDDDGFVEYAPPPHGFLVNEGWKDSADSVRFRTGEIARGPIALVEVQGYVVDALGRAAEIKEALGEPEEAERLRGRQAKIREALDSRFWLDDRRTFAEALDGSKRRVDSLTSNPGHLLWARAIDPARARAVAEALLGDEMFSGWGVRTMGRAEGGYNPISYHNGSVWPHDNALFLKGLVHYRLDSKAELLAGAQLEALRAFPDHRFPEVFCGYSVREAGCPVPYPNANKPQAWASGSVLLLVRSILGLEVDALHRRLSVRPLRVPGLNRIAWSSVAVGTKRARIEVSYDRAEPHVTVEGLESGWDIQHRSQEP